jgi:hypothetical protein
MVMGFVPTAQVTECILIFYFLSLLNAGSNLHRRRPVPAAASLGFAEQDYVLPAPQRPPALEINNNEPRSFYTPTDHSASK